MDILSEIFAHKSLEVEARKRACSLADMRRLAEAASIPAEMVPALRGASTRPALIAEVKFHSPSRGELLKDQDPLRLAFAYERHRAAAISVLTDAAYFHGQMDYLRRIHAALPGMPLLQKDFIFDPYQIFEARLAGASAILLIAARLDPPRLMDLHALALTLGLAPLVEVHDRAKLEIALRLPGLRLLGVNNRDLRTFEVRLQTCLDLRPSVPPGVVLVAESGIRTREDIQRLQAAEVDAVLVGEALVTAADPGAAIDELFGQGERAAAP